MVALSGATLSVCSRRITVWEGTAPKAGAKSLLLKFLYHPGPQWREGRPDCLLPTSHLLLSFVLFFFTLLADRWSARYVWLYGGGTAFLPRCAEAGHPGRRWSYEGDVPRPERHREDSLETVPSLLGASKLSATKKLFGPLDARCHWKVSPPELHQSQETPAGG